VTVHNQIELPCQSSSAALAGMEVMRALVAAWAAQAVTAAERWHHPRGLLSRLHGGPQGPALPSCHSRLCLATPLEKTRHPPVSAAHPFVHYPPRLHMPYRWQRVTDVPRPQMHCQVWTRAAERSWQGGPYQAHLAALVAAMAARWHVWHRRDRPRHPRCSRVEDD